MPYGAAAMEDADAPFRRFAEVYDKARVAQPRDPNAVVLATVGADGRPSARFVLLKGFDSSGFVFYTNLESRKSRELLNCPYASLCFYWPQLDEQVRVEGKATVVPDSEADAYFATRPRESQLGAWASHQSRTLKSREELQKRFAEFERRFANQNVPRPPHWSGFRLVPDRFEFWHSRPNRLHDRTLYIREGEGWRTELLYP
jgi:pyridoxamine 5'-phosphate oxidase